jgi:hypothetical protein
LYGKAENAGKISEANLFSTVSSYGDTEYGIWNVVLQTKKKRGSVVVNRTGETERN